MKRIHFFLISACMLAASATTTSQNVGIGTTTPAELLHVAGKTRTDQLQVTTGAAAGYVLTSDLLGNATWQAPGGGGGGLPSGTANDTLRCVGGTTWVANNDVVITSSGYVGIGTTSPSSSHDLTIGTAGFRSNGADNLCTGRLGVGLTLSPSTSYDLDIGNSGFRSQGTSNVITGTLAVSRSTSASYDLHVDGDARFENIGVNVNPSTSYKLYVSGNVRFTSLGTGTGTAMIITSGGDVRQQSSTIRHKTDVRDLEFAHEDLLALRPVHFRWKPEHGGEEDVGLIAEEVAERLPELVFYAPLSSVAGEANESSSVADTAAGDQLVPAGVHYDKVGVYLLEVVAAQAKQIESLEARLARLEALIGAPAAVPAEDESSGAERENESGSKGR